LIDLDVSVVFKKGVEEDVHRYGEMQSTYSKRDSVGCNDLKEGQGGFYVYSNRYNDRALHFEEETLQEVRQVALLLRDLLCRWRVGKVSVPRQFGFATYVQHCTPVWQTMKNSFYQIHVT